MIERGLVHACPVEIQRRQVSGSVPEAMANCYSMASLDREVPCLNGAPRKPRPCCLLYQPGLGGGDPRVIRLGSGGLSSHVALCSVHTTGFGWAGLMVRQPQIIVLAALLKVGILKILEEYSY